jgi:hypothetical protein
MRCGKVGHRYIKRCQKVLSLGYPQLIMSLCEKHANEYLSCFDVTANAQTGVLTKHKYENATLDEFWCTKS